LKVAVRLEQFSSSYVWYLALRATRTASLPVSLGVRQNDTAVNCIFCKQEALSKTVAHIIPESLGGKNSPVGRPGVTCDACNQYFG